jgi:PDZ domain/Aspartyl protease
MRRLIARILFSTLLFCSLEEVHAQEFFSQPNAKLITRVPLHLFSGGVIMVRARFNDIPDTLNFILDTGSGGISLDSSTVDYFNIPLMESDRTIRGIGGIRKVSFHYNGRLTLPGLVVDSLDFHVNDYTLLTSVYGVKIDGIIGYSFFRRYIVSLDYDNMSMEVYTQGDYKYPRGGYTLKPQLPAGIPIQGMKLQDSRWFDTRYYLDTGAGLCVLLSESFNADSVVLGKKKKIVTTQAEGMGGKMRMQLTTVREIRLGPYRFKNVPTYLFDDVNNVTAYPFLSGLIGNDLLRRFNMVINYSKREVHLMPNTHYNDPFDYAYTGLSIYFNDSKIEVEDVVKGSPADKAGLKVGDVLLGVNNDFTNNIQTYKNLLQVSGARIRMLVMRDGFPQIIQMKPERIL